jgi:hypothetical protein
MPKPKTKVIATRVGEPMYNFLGQIVKEMNQTNNSNLTRGDLLRLIIEYFFMAYSLGDFKKPLPELRKEFKDWLNSLSK